MLHKLKKKDFAVLRGPLESGRQSPDSLGGALLLAIFLQMLMYYVTYYIAAEATNFPNVGRIQVIHFWISACLVLLSAIYSIPIIYNRSQKIQYLISILAIQNIGAAGCYLSAIFAIGSWSDITVMALMDLTKLTLIVGMVVFLATSIRFYILLLKAKYRRGSQKDQLRNKFEKSSYLPLAILGSTVFFIVSQYFVRMLNWTDIQMMITAIMFIGVFYTMIFVLPEQLMILYCKFRFKSFNFDKDGVLYKK